MRVIGLDLSLSDTGLAVMDCGDPRTPAIHLQSIKTTPEDGSAVVRADYISEIINERVLMLQPELIVIEEYAFSRPGSKLGELGGIVKLGLWKATTIDECWITIPSTTVKKHMTGSGKASKQDMIAAATPYIPYEFDYLCRNHNVCDAIGLALTGYSRLA